MAERYYAMIDGEQKGPYTLEELPAAGVRPSTYIWAKGMPDWQKAEDNAEVCRLFRNHLYDVMHPGEPSDTGRDAMNRLSSDSQRPTINGQPNPDPLDKYRIKPDEPKGPAPTRFDRFLQEAGEDPLPTLEEIESQKDTSQPPVSVIAYAWLVTFLCCFPTGIVALVYAYKTKSAWNKGDNKGAWEYHRKALMWTGVSFFLGLIGYGLFLALSL